jgi:hypothetical protein
MRHGIEITGLVDTSRSPVTQRFEDDEGLHLLANVSEFDVLQSEIRQFVWDRVPEDEAWESTRGVLDYLEFDVLEILLLGFQSQRDEAPVWSLALMFESNGGTGEVSGAVAAHWVETWFESHREAIGRQLLEPSGFTPTGEAAAFVVAPDLVVPCLRRNDLHRGSCPTFFPIAATSYAERLSGPLDDSHPPFDIDFGVADSLPDGGLELLAELIANRPDAATESRCRCQLCESDA